MDRCHVLVVDDEAELTDMLKFSLSHTGHRVSVAHDGATALAVFPELQPDLVVLDLTMPGLDGFSVLKRIRRSSSVPILVLSARHSTQIKVRALNEGADDYLTKPFEFDELLARLSALLRRMTQCPPDEHAEVQTFGDLCIDPGRRCVTLQGDPVHLTPTEYSLLAEFAAHPGEVLAHSALLQRVWGPEYVSESQYLHVYVQRLRSKFEEDPANPCYIVTELGVGYRFYPNGL